MAKAKEVTAQFHMVGDKVLWKGILLVVTAVRDNGYIECWSPTMQLTVDTHEQLEKFKCLT